MFLSCILFSYLHVSNEILSFHAIQVLEELKLFVVRFHSNFIELKHVLQLRWKFKRK